MKKVPLTDVIVIFSPIANMLSVFHAPLLEISQGAVGRVVLALAIFVRVNSFDVGPIHH